MGLAGSCTLWFEMIKMAGNNLGWLNTELSTKQHIALGQVAGWTLLVISIFQTDVESLCPYSKVTQGMCTQKNIELILHTSSLCKA